MIDEVMRLTTFFASMMACCTFGLAVAITVAGTLERTSAGCYACLDAGEALARLRPPEPQGRLRVAIRAGRPAS